MTTFGDLFTERQLVALSTLGEVLKGGIQKIESDSLSSGLSDDPTPLCDGGIGAKAYAQAVSVYLSCAIDRCADFNNALTTWSQSNQKVMHLFGRQAIPMVWDFAEANILSNTVGSFSNSVQLHF